MDHMIPSHTHLPTLPVKERECWRLSDHLLPYQSPTWWKSYTHSEREGHMFERVVVALIEPVR